MYFVIELQTNANGTSGNFVFNFSNREDAEAKYGTLYAAAAKSDVMVHTVLLMTNRGQLLESKYFVHPAEE